MRNEVYQRSRNIVRFPFGSRMVIAVRNHPRTFIVLSPEELISFHDKGTHREVVIKKNPLFFSDWEKFGMEKKDKDTYKVETMIPYWELYMFGKER